MSAEATLAGAQLVDHHCHGVVAVDLDQDAFESFINEGFDRPASGTSHFDAPIGLAVRRWCAPVLDLEPFATAETYVARRLELGAREVNERFLRASGLQALFLDSGYRSDEILGVRELGEIAGIESREVVRLEGVAEGVAATGPRAEEYPNAFALALEAAARDAVGLKTIIAYRGGFDIDPTPPARRDVVRAADRWLRSGATSPRLIDPVLLRHSIWTGAELASSRGLPLQIHAGFGDPDLTLHLANPSLLTQFVRALGAKGVDVVFLHCYPYHREAAYLAAMFPNVYLDVGSVLHYTGASSDRVLAAVMELAPFTKHLYSSDAFGAAELYLLGSTLFRRALARTLDGWIESGQCSPAEAERIAGLVAAGNARRIYTQWGPDAIRRAPGTPLAPSQ
jgi:predicted TIM-barrel fold metal-dependent hydrolase